MHRETKQQEPVNMVFTPSARYTLGVEIEFQTLDRNTLNLAPMAPVLLANSPTILKPRLAEELIQSILELRTGICFSLADVEYDLQQTCCLAEELAAESGCILHCASLHPFASIDDQVLTDNPRYHRIMEELQFVGRQFISQGFHVHVGMPDGETAVRVVNAIQAYLPLLLAASASSPYFQGVDTGFMSYRTKLFELLPLAGIYTYLRDWDHYQHVVQKLVEHGVIESCRDLWWDGRLHPGFGTVEIRICDLPGRFSDILGLVATIQCLAALLAEDKTGTGPLNSHVLQANKWQAARHGLAGMFIDPANLLGPPRQDMRSAFARLLTVLQPMSIRLGCQRYLQKATGILAHDTAAVRQRSVYRETADMKEIVRTLHREFWT